jgi:PH domain/Kinesin motor domain
LRESLGGNCKTTLLITISPHWFNAEETVSTLKFGLRAKTIKNEVRQNVQRSVQELNAIIRKLTRDLDIAEAYIAALEREARAGIPLGFDVDAFRAANRKATDVDRVSVPSAESSDPTDSTIPVSVADDGKPESSESARASRSRGSTLAAVSESVRLEQRAEGAELEVARLADELEAARVELDDVREKLAKNERDSGVERRRLEQELQQAEQVARRAEEERKGAEFELNELDIVHKRDEALLKAALRAVDEQKQRRRAAEHALGEVEEATGVRLAGHDRRPVSRDVSVEVLGAAHLDTTSSAPHESKSEKNARDTSATDLSSAAGAAERDSQEGQSVNVISAGDLELERQLHQRELQLLRERIAEVEASRHEERRRNDELNVRLIQAQATLAETMNAHLEELQQRDALLALRKRQAVPRAVPASPVRSQEERRVETHFSPFHVLALHFRTRNQRDFSRESLGVALVEGYLQKQGGLLRNWLRRWFVLQNGHMYYYTGPDCKDQKGAIPLDECVARPVSPAEAKGRTLAFGVFHASRRTFLCQAENQEDFDTWIAAINKVASPEEEDGAAGSDSPGDSGGSDGDLVDEEIPL